MLLFFFKALLNFKSLSSCDYRFNALTFHLSQAYLENVPFEVLGGRTRSDVGSEQNWAQSGCDAEVELEGGIGETRQGE